MQVVGAVEVVCIESFQDVRVVVRDARGQLDADGATLQSSINCRPPYPTKHFIVPPEPEVIAEIKGPGGAPSTFT